MLPDRHGGDVIGRVSRVFDTPRALIELPRLPADAPICEPCWLHPSPRALAMDRPEIDIHRAGHPLCPHGGERS